MSAAVRKITVPEINGKLLPLTQAALLAALSRFGRIASDRQLSALVWWVQRYLAAWLTPRRFFANSRSYSIGFIIGARDVLAAEGSIILEASPFGAQFYCSIAGKDLASKLRAAMPEALSETEFADARAQHQHERRLRRGYFAP